jgi:hypothetical protein
MILIYTLMLFLLGMLKLLVSMRARALERKFMTIAKLVDEHVRQAQVKPGNANKHDLCVTAKATLVLGHLVDKRDRVEAKHDAWQCWADRLTRWVATLRDWKGKTVPYTLGAVDVWMLMQFIDYMGVGQVLGTLNVIQLAVTWFTE